MKSVLIVYLILTLATIASAQNITSSPLDPAAAELCQLETTDVPVDVEAFTELETLDIKKVTSLTSFQLSLVNQHLIHQEYTQKPLKFAKIKKLFGENGAQSANDLHVITFKSIQSGRIYIQVKSWPGDNPYGLIFDAESGDLLAYNQDDTIYLASPHGGQIYCGDLKK